MKDRLIQLRKSKKMTQGEFGQEIGLTDPMISLFESGKKIPQDQTIKLICYTFKIREEWLRYGTGEMEKPTEAETNDEKLIVSLFRQLSREMKAVALKKMRELLAADASWVPPESVDETPPAYGQNNKKERKRA